MDRLTKWFSSSERSEPERPSLPKGPLPTRKQEVVKKIVDSTLKDSEKLQDQSAQSTSASLSPRISQTVPEISQIQKLIGRFRTSQEVYKLIGPFPELKAKFLPKGLSEEEQTRKIEEWAERVNKQLDQAIADELGVLKEGEEFNPGRVFFNAAKDNRIELVQFFCFTEDPHDAKGYCPAVQQGLLFSDNQVTVFMDEPDSTGQSPLTVAARLGHLEVVKVLINAGATDRGSALISAAGGGQLEVVEFLLGVCDRFWDKKNINLALISAAGSGKLKIMDVLFKSGAAVSAVNNNGNSALMMAARKGNLDVVNVLLKIGVGNEDKDKALLCAAENGQFEIVNTLLNVGARVSVINNEGKSALMIAAGRRDLETVKILLKSGADVFQVDHDGNSVLGSAILSGDLRVVATILEADARINVNQALFLPHPGKRPQPIPLLSYAMVTRWPDLIALLKAQKANEAYASEYIRRKFLANLWGIRGPSTLTDKEKQNTITFELEGGSVYDDMQTLHRYVGDFFDVGNLKKGEQKTFFGVFNRKKDLISKSDKKEIQKAIAECFPISQESDAQIMKKINEREPIVIMGGITGHAIGIVIAKNQLAIFNRGPGTHSSNAGIKFYPLPTPFTEDMIKNLKLTYPDIDSFQRMIRGLGVKPSRFARHKPQKMGNCVWADAKGIFGIFCRLYTNDDIGRAMSKDFNLFARRKGFDEYMNATESEPTYRDNALLDEIVIKQEKYKNKVAK